QLPTRGPLSAVGSTSGGPGGAARFMLVVAIVLAGVLGLLAIWLPGLPWKRRGAASAGHYYARMLSWARWLRLGPASYQTPYEFADNFAREIPGSATFARNITRAYVRERFSRTRPSPDERASLGKAWDSLRASLVRSWPARQVTRMRRRRRRR